MTYFNGLVTVSTTPTPICSMGERAGVLIQNTGSAAVFLGDEKGRPRRKRDARVGAGRRHIRPTQRWPNELGNFDWVNALDLPEKETYP
jgi:hypothetical protein